MQITFVKLYSDRWLQPWWKVSIFEQKSSTNCPFFKWALFLQPTIWSIKVIKFVFSFCFSPDSSLKRAQTVKTQEKNLSNQSDSGPLGISTSALITFWWNALIELCRAETRWTSDKRCRADAGCRDDSRCSANTGCRL